MIIDLRGFGALAPGAGQPVIVTSEPVYTPPPAPLPTGSVITPTGDGQLVSDTQAGLSRSLGVPPVIGEWNVPPVALVAGPAFNMDWIVRFKQANEVANRAHDLAKFQPDPEIGRIAVSANDGIAVEMNTLMPVLEALASSWNAYSTAVAEREPLTSINGKRDGLIWWANRSNEHLGIFIIQGNARVRAVADQVYPVLEARAKAAAEAAAAAQAQAEAEAVIAKAEAEAEAAEAEEEARLDAEAAVQAQALAQAARVQEIFEAATAAGADPAQLQTVVQATEEAIAQGVPPEAALAQALATPTTSGISVGKVALLTGGGLLLLKLLMK